MSKASDKPKFSLTLQAVPGWDVPPIIRLRKFLKAAIRSYGLRCTEIRETTDRHDQHDRDTES